MIDTQEFTLRVAAALAMALVIGFEREAKHKPLGARAYALVAMGTAGFMASTIQFALGDVSMEAGVKLDPSRLIQGVVGGIGFLGAGAIISGQSDGRLRGVASGAAVWVVGAIGIACGCGLYAEAAIMTGLTFAVLTIYGWLENRTEVVNGGRKADD